MKFALATPAALGALAGLLILAYCAKYGSGLKEPVELRYWYYCATGCSSDKPSDFVNPKWTLISSQLGLPQSVARRESVWVKTKLPDSLPPAATVSIASVRQAYVAHLGDREIHRFGSVSDDLAGGYQGDPVQMFALPEHLDSRTLYLKIFSNGAAIGLRRPTLAGDPMQIFAQSFQTQWGTLVVGLLTFGAGFIAIALFMTTLHIRSLCWFGTVGIGLGIYHVCHTQIPGTIWGHPLLWDYLQYGATYLTPGAFILLISELIPPASKRLGQALALSFLALSLGTIAGSAFELFVLPASIPLFQAMLALGISTTVGGVLLKLGSRTPGSRQFILFTALFGLSVLHDVLVQRRTLPWSFTLSHWGSFAFVASLAQMVANRTQQDTRQRLAMSAELETAWILQSQFMQQQRLASEIFGLQAYSKAASHLAGDWYAYRLIRDRWLQFHVGDITGHGARAALLAAFSKGAVDLFYERDRLRDDGASHLDELHDLLNRALLQVGSSTASMTLCSISIDLQTGILSYLNSGHPAALILKDSDGGEDPPSFDQLKKRNLNLLGVSHDFQSHKPSRIQLAGNETIVLVSDGVLELFQGAARPVVRSVADLLIAKGAHQDINRTCEVIASLAKRFEATGAELPDDVTVLAVNVKIARSMVFERIEESGLNPLPEFRNSAS